MRKLPSFVLVGIGFLIGSLAVGAVAGCWIGCGIESPEGRSKLLRAVVATMATTSILCLVLMSSVECITHYFERKR